MQFLQDLIDNKDPDDWWQDYKDFCNEISKVDRSLFIEALPALLKKLENNYAHRDLRIALENESKSNATFGKEIYSKILEAKNPYLYDSLTDIICGLYKSDQKFTITIIKSLIKDVELSLSRVGIQSC